MYSCVLVAFAFAKTAMQVQVGMQATKGGRGGQGTRAGGHAAFADPPEAPEPPSIPIYRNLTAAPYSHPYAVPLPPQLEPLPCRVTHPRTSSSWVPSGSVLMPKKRFFR
mgnify:CR=1 FL=1